MSGDTYNELRHYSSKPYIKFLANPCRIGVNDLLLDLQAFVLQRQESWGDPLPFDLTDFNIVFRMYDKNNQIVAEGTAATVATDRGEIKYVWREFDKQCAGLFTGEFIFTKNGKSLTLPQPQNRLQIVVTD